MKYTPNISIEEQQARKALYQLYDGACPQCGAPLDKDTARCTNPYKCINGNVCEDD